MQQGLEANSLKKKINVGGFPGSIIIRTLPSSAEAWVWSLVGELRSHMPPGQKLNYKTEAVL